MKGRRGSREWRKGGGREGGRGGEREEGGREDAVSALQVGMRRAGWRHRYPPNLRGNGSERQKKGSGDAETSGNITIEGFTKEQQ